ncbi:MAG: transcriptional regulator [Comamonadaceae bacterium]|nr:MAG: transcriptional regulator [Comamonadaceae bacterium]
MENSVIKTAGRVFEILEYFREVRRPLSVRDIAEYFDYPPSSTSVLVKSIATLGYLSYDSRIRAYSPTILVAMLGDWIYESSFGSAEILGLMRSLSDATLETVILAVQNDVQSQYVQVIQSRLPIQFYVSPGTRRPLCASGTGWALLAPQSDAAIARIHQRSEARLGKGGLPADMGLDDVMAQVRKVRSAGYVYSRGTNTPGVGVIAMPLPATAKGAQLVIGIGGLIERLDKSEKRLARLMKESIAMHVKDDDAAPAKPRRAVAGRASNESAPTPVPSPAPVASRARSAGPAPAVKSTKLSRPARPKA